MNCVYILFTSQQLIFVNLKDDKNKRNTALFCNMKAKTRCVYCKIKNIIVFFVISGFCVVYLVSSVTVNKLSRVTSSSTIAECFPGKTPYVVTIVMRVLQRVAVSARNIAIRSRKRRS